MLVLNCLLAPDGSIHPVTEEDDQHEAVAWRIMGCPMAGEYNRATYCLDELCKRGWLILSTVRYGSWISTDFNRGLTDAQESTLWDMYLDAKSGAQTIYTEAAIESMRKVLGIRESQS